MIREERTSKMNWNEKIKPTRVVFAIKNTETGKISYCETKEDVERMCNYNFTYVGEYEQWD